MKYICTLDDKINNEFVIEMSKIFNLDSHLVHLLYSRGIDTQDKLKNFLNPSLTDLNDPFLFENMKEAVELIERHIANNSSILVFGDYDVDGISASAILIKYFTSIGVKVSNFMPNRYEDGYGLTIDSINKICEKEKPDLIVTVDCGITAVEEVRYIQSLGIDVLVTDHHERAETLPDCLIINPKVSETYPFKSLCGAGVALKLVQALAGLNTASQYLPICAIATIADIVELFEENRSIVALGIKNISKLPQGVLKLMHECGLNENCKASDIAFKLAPKINASGRMGSAETSLQLYLEENPSVIKKLCTQILSYNNQRQQLCDKVYNDVTSELKRMDIFRVSAIVMSSAEWDSGILGIVSARIAEEYHRPTFLFSQVGDELVGSCRSVNGVNVHTLLSSMSHLLTKFGGHPMAAGLTLKVDKYDEFVRLTNAYVDENLNKSDFLPTKSFDFMLDESEITLKFVEDIDRLEPCGHKNPRPIFNFKLKNAIISSLPKHPQHLVLSYPNFSLLSFNSSDMYFILSGNTSCNVLADLNVDTFRNSKKISGIVKSIDYEDIYRPQDSEIIEAEYIRQIAYPMDGTYTFNNYNRDQLIRLLVDMEKNVYGTLIVANDYNTYINFKAIYDSNNIFTNRVMTINDATGLNTILLAPSNFESFNTFSRIIFLDPVLNMGYLSALQKVTKSTVYLPHIMDYNCSILKKINLSRNEFGRYFRLIQFALENKITGYYTYHLFKNILFKLKEKVNYSYLQFFVCLQVFKELGIVITNPEDTEIEKITGVKSPLNASAFYNRLNTMKQNKE
ncbi:MAG: single-stranded-DNA-specific exonuclease RecJ [Clostridiales bacterium]|nr:single-stranded-DNA-specific exonuclease RecJ [Clostridiales bacterium]